MQFNAKHEANPEAESGLDLERQGGQARVSPVADHSAESCIEAFCSARMSLAVKTLQDVIAEDYAQFMSQQTGIHADYFRP